MSEIDDLDRAARIDPDWALIKERRDLESRLAAAEARAEKAEGERDEAVQNRSNAAAAAYAAIEWREEGIAKHTALLAENRALLRMMDVATSPDDAPFDVAELLALTAAEVERVRGLEESVERMRAALEGVDRDILNSFPHGIDPWARSHLRVAREKIAAALPPAKEA
jgi:hypothetical protein